MRLGRNSYHGNNGLIGDVVVGNNGLIGDVVVWRKGDSVEVHVAAARMFVTFCSAVSQHHVVKRFFFDTERNVSRTIVLETFLFDRYVGEYSSSEKNCNRIKVSRLSQVVPGKPEFPFHKIYSLIE